MLARVKKMMGPKVNIKYLISFLKNHLGIISPLVVR